VLLPAEQKRYSKRRSETDQLTHAREWGIVGATDRGGRASPAVIRSSSKREE
jgi:hypothetical protein